MVRALLEEVYLERATLALEMKWGLQIQRMVDWEALVVEVRQTFAELPWLRLPLNIALFDS